MRCNVLSCLLSLTLVLNHEVRSDVTAGYENVEEQQGESHQEFGLVDSYGNAVGAGILGLLINNGGTVCDDDFSINSADAICRKMGYLRHMQWTSGDKWTIQSSLQITLDDVLCSSGEWSSCSFSTTQNCGHSEDVFLQCDGIVDGGYSDFGEWSECSALCGGGIQTRTRTCTQPAPAHGGADCVGEASESKPCNENDCPEFSLIDSNSNAVGATAKIRGLLINNGGTVCDDGFDSNSADAICRKMGYLGHTEWNSGDKWTIQSSLEITLDDLLCSSGEWSSCSFKSTNDCGHSEDVFLQCDGIEFSLINSIAKAVGARTFGLLMNNGGTVCDDYFDSYSADAICRKMGYSGHMQWTSGDKWSIQSSLQITLDDVLCSSGEWSSCSFKSTNDCGHSEDVFLQCDGIVDGGYSDFGEWSKCSALCKGGIQTRTRTCTQPAPAHGGADCVGEASESKPCNENDCPEFSLVDSNGSAIGPTARILGLLMNNGGTVCDDYFSTNSADAICRKMGYPGYWQWTSGDKWTIQSTLQITLDDVLCSSGEWNSCSFKSTTDCSHIEDVFLQCDGIVDGGYSDFGEWSTCSSRCKGGIQTRTRTCTQPAPAHGGADCVGEAAESKPCNENEICPEFSLIDLNGNAVSAGVLGLLMNNGGTVCDDYFSYNSANAICRKMGYPGYWRWTSGDKWTIQSTLQITLDDVLCSSGEWSSCSFKSTNDCGHSKDVFLQCDGFDRCGFMNQGGFLKFTCRQYSGGWESKCHNSDEWYMKGESGKMDQYGKLVSIKTLNKCTNDEKSYQACGTFYFEPFQSLTNALCQWQVDNYGILFDAAVDDKQLKNKTGVILPTGQEVNQDQICNDICDEGADCEDEAHCNGLTYGQYSHVDNQVKYTRPIVICTPIHGENCNCNVTEMCDPQNFEEKDLCRRPISILERYNPIYDKFPVFNFTRCSTTNICLNNVDQFNCSDHLRVGMTCEIHAYISTVSKYRICESVPFCDDGIDSICEQVSASCYVQKHFLCNGVSDCKDDSDERILLCQAKTNLSCIRRGGNGTFSQPLPLAWLRDGIKDCINGDDEKDIWPECGSGKTRRYVTDNSICENVFLCTTGNPGFIGFDDLCDGIDTCGNENEICEESRGSISVSKAVVTHNQGLEKILSYCFKGLEQVGKLIHPCGSEHFIFPNDDIYGLMKSKITLPNVTTSCDHMFGEQYVYSSCNNKCINSPCPLKNIPEYNSCPGQYPDRVATIANKGKCNEYDEYLTLAVKSGGANDSVFVNDIFVCDNGIKCVSYSQVCDLVDDCGDGSDETRCTNHFKCKASGHYIPKTSKCDGKFDCLDLTDECNDECSKEILEGSVLKGLSWTIGILAVLANFSIIVCSIKSFKKCRTTVAQTNKSLVIMISVGDLLVGSYLLAVSVFDVAVHGKDYCKKQTAWLTSSECSLLGVASTIGSQLSLFAMTVLSLVRFHGIVSSMRIPGEVTVKSSIKVMALNVSILALSAAIAVTPVLQKYEDFFVNGVRYDADLKLFIGLVSKKTHSGVFEKYFGRMNDRSLSWDAIDKMTSEMFSHDHGAKDFTKTESKVGFYGNDGVCLFKYFIRKTEPQMAFVWSILAINFTCFVVILACYIVIGVFSNRSSNKVTAGRVDKQIRQRNRRMNRKIAIIITTDFLCWVPFIIICMLHYTEIVDATPWYSIISMVIFPINSVINPLLYNDLIAQFMLKKLSGASRKLSSHASTMYSRYTSSTPTENVELQEIK